MNYEYYTVHFRTRATELPLYYCSLTQKQLIST